MTQLGQQLGKPFNQQFETRITGINGVNGLWRLQSGDTVVGDFDWVILATPSPQAVAIMPDRFCHRATLAAAEMRACYTLMLGFEEWRDLGFDAATVLNSDISWLAVNHSKTGRNENPALVVHSTGEWAHRHLNAERDQVIGHLIESTQQVINQVLPPIVHRDLHRWLYADVSEAAGEPALIDHDNKLAAIGDWCLSGRVESAFTSGLAAAEILDEI